MHLRYGLLILFLGLAIIVLAPRTGQAQDGGSTCEQLVQRAISELGTNCANLGPNSACYGFETVSATLADGVPMPDDFFAAPGYKTELTNLNTVQTVKLNTAQSIWGISVFNVLANIPAALADQSVVYMLVGDVQIINDVPPDEALLPGPPVAIATTAQANAMSDPGTDADVLGAIPLGTTLNADGVSPDGQWVRVMFQNRVAWVQAGVLDSSVDLSTLPIIRRDSFTPMQSFQLQTGMGQPSCAAEPPSVLVVQSPTDIPVDIRVNGVNIRVDGTVFLRTLPNNRLQVITGSGGVYVFPDSANEVFVQAGTTITIPLDGPERWEDWRVMSQNEWDGFAAFETIPSNIWIDYVNPDIITASGIQGPIPVIVTEDGQIIPVPPPVRTFPVIDMAAGELGEGLERVAWDPFTVGAATCPNFVLYHSDRGGDWDIYRLGGTGTTDNVSQGDGSADLQPSESIDGQWVAFTSNRDILGGWEIYVARTDGSDQIRVTYNTASDVNPVWGPDNRIAFESNRDGNWEIYMVDVSGDGMPVRLTDDDGNDINPFWTPDGETLIFQSDRDGDWELYALNLTSGEVTQLTDNETQDQDPVVSHNGERLAWLQMSDWGVYDLWLMDLTTGETLQLTNTGTDVGSPNFSPDDSFLAYHSNVDGDFDIFAVEIETGVIKALTSNDAEDRAPTFRCNSPVVVYHSDIAADEDNPGQREVYEVNPLPLDGPANNPVRLTNEVESDDIYPLGDPREEVNSREGQVPSVVP